MKRFLFTLLFLAWSSTASAALAFVQQINDWVPSSGCNPSCTSVAFGSSPTTGNGMVGFVFFDSLSTTLSSVTSSTSNTWHLQCGPYDGEVALGYRAYIIYAQNITGGASFTVTFNFSGTVNTLRYSVHEYSGGSTTAFFDNCSGASGLLSTTPNSGNFTQTFTNEMLVGAGMATGITAGSGWSAPTGNNRLETANKSSTALGTQSAPWTSSFTVWLAVGAGLKDATQPSANRRRGGLF